MLLNALTPLGGVLVQVGETGGRQGSLFEVVEEADILGSWLRSTGQRIAVARPDHYASTAPLPHLSKRSRSCRA